MSATGNIQWQVFRENITSVEPIASCQLAHFRTSKTNEAANQSYFEIIIAEILVFLRIHMSAMRQPVEHFPVTRMQPVALLFVHSAVWRLESCNQSWFSKFLNSYPGHPNLTFLFHSWQQTKIPLCCRINRQNRTFWFSFFVSFVKRVWVRSILLRFCTQNKAFVCCSASKFIILAKKKFLLRDRASVNTVQALMPLCLEEDKVSRTFSINRKFRKMDTCQHSSAKCATEHFLAQQAVSHEKQLMGWRPRQTPTKQQSFGFTRRVPNLKSIWDTNPSWYALHKINLGPIHTGRDHANSFGNTASSVNTPIRNSICIYQWYESSLFSAHFLNGRASPKTTTEGAAGESAAILEQPHTEDTMSILRSKT